MPDDTSLVTPDKPDASVVRPRRSVITKLDRPEIAEFLRIIWRRKWLMAMTVFSITLIAYVVVTQLPPQYTASSRIMIDPRKNQVVNIETVISGMPSDLETIASELEVLQSRGLAERVIRKLKLYEHPEFNTRLRQPSGLSKFMATLRPSNWLPEELTALFTASTAKPPPSEEERLSREKAAIIDTYLGRLGVSRVKRSRVLEITLVLEDPAMAAQVANVHADLYIVEQLEAKFEATRRATAWLNERLASLKQNVERSESAVEAFRNKSGLLEGKGVTVASQQMSELNTQLILARTKQAEAQARLRQVEELLKGRNGAESVAEVLTSPLIQNLREEEGKVQRRAAELSQEFGDKHPRMINIRAEIADVRRKIDVEVNKIVQGLRNEVKVAQVREDTLMENLRQVETRVGSINRNEVELRALQREANANRTLYETFLSRFKETSEQESIQQPDARIISRADTPTAPSAPKKRLILVLVVISATIMAVGLVLLIERLDHGFRSMEQIEETTGIPAIGLVPLLTGVRGLTTSPIDHIVERPNSAFGESIRALHASLLLSDVDSPPKVVLVTSSLPNEGKTSVSVALARMIAQSGQKKVCLIDCDLRRPQIATALGLQPHPGIVELAAGEASLDEIIQVDKPSGALVITSGRNTATPTDLITSNAFRTMISNVSRICDFVVVDSPPVLAVSDARLLSTLVDKTVFVTRWADTRREIAVLGIKQLAEAGADFGGVLLSMVNVRKNARYGYGDSGYYYGRYRKYYSD